MVISVLALFIALGGTATALKGKNTVFSDDIKNGQVKTKDLADNAVAGDKIADGAILNRHFAPGIITSDVIAPSAITSEKIAPEAIGSREIADGAIGPDQVDPATPAASVTHSADQSISAGPATTLAFDTEVFDTASVHSASPNSCLTPPVDGVYDISANVAWAARNNGFRQVFLVKGANVLAQDATDALSDGGSQTVQNVSATVALEDGDCIQVVVAQFSMTGGPPTPSPLAVKSGTGSTGVTPNFSMVYAVPGS